MRCRICDTVRKNSPKNTVCKICEYVMGLTILSISEYWWDIIKENKSLRMKEYYRKVLVYERSKLLRPRTGV